MKKKVIAAVLLLGLAVAVFGQETYTLTYRGNVQGTVTVQQDKGGKITITPKITGFAIHIDHALCPLIPESADIVVYSGVISIPMDGGYPTPITNTSDNWVKTVIDGNTTTVTWSDGSWKKTVVVVDGNTTTRTYTESNSPWERRGKTVVDGNTTTETYTDGDWTKTVVDGNTTTRTGLHPSKTIIDGNTTTITWPDGSWEKTVVDGNTTTVTESDGDWTKTVIDGNTTTITWSDTWSDGDWRKTVVDGNTTTITWSDGSWEKTVIDKQGKNIYITIMSG